MANARKILIVDDDTDLREALVEQLSLHEEFEASAVDTGAKGATAAKINSPDLVLMDVGLPDTDGREVVRSLRKGALKPPLRSERTTSRPSVSGRPTSMSTRSGELILAAVAPLAPVSTAEASNSSCSDNCSTSASRRSVSSSTIRILRALAIAWSLVERGDAREALVPMQTEVRLTTQACYRFNTDR